MLRKFGQQVLGSHYVDDGENKLPGSKPGFTATSVLRTHLERKMAEFIASSREDIFSEIGRIFEETPNEAITAVCNKCVIRLEWMTEHKDEYNPLHFK
jgi:hypothetical protein